MKEIVNKWETDITMVSYIKEMNVLANSPRLRGGGGKT